MAKLTKLTLNVVETLLFLAATFVLMSVSALISDVDWCKEVEEQMYIFGLICVWLFLVWVTFLKNFMGDK